VGGEGKGERTGDVKKVHNLRKMTPRHQMAGYGPASDLPQQTEKLAQYRSLLNILSERKISNSLKTK